MVEKESKKTQMNRAPKVHLGQQWALWAEEKEGRQDQPHIEHFHGNVCLCPPHNLYTKVLNPMRW